METVIVLAEESRWTSHYVTTVLILHTLIIDTIKPVRAVYYSTRRNLRITLVFVASEPRSTKHIAASDYRRNWQAVIIKAIEPH